MKPISLRGKLGLVAAGYALVLATAAALVLGRRMQYLSHPNDVAAAGGMYAGGDLILEIFILCMFLVPTFFLALVIRNSENLYVSYSRVLIGLSLTAPICLAVSSIPAVGQSTMVLGEICIDRLFGSPIVIVGFFVSRLLAQFDRAKRLTSWALLIEVSTLALGVALLVFSAKRH